MARTASPAPAIQFPRRVDARPTDILKSFGEEGYPDLEDQLMLIQHDADPVIMV